MLLLAECENPDTSRVEPILPGRFSAPTLAPRCPQTVPPPLCFWVSDRALWAQSQCVLLRVVLTI